MGLSNAGDKLKADNKNSSLHYLEGNTGEVCQGNRGVVEGFLLRKRNKKRKEKKPIQESARKREGPPEMMGWDGTRENKHRG